MTAEESLQLAGEAARRGEFAEVEAHCRRAIAKRANLPDGWHLLAVALLQLGRQEESVGAFERAIAMAPGAAVFRSNYSDLLRRLGRSSDAEAQARRAIAIQGDYAPAHNNLGMALRALGREGEALNSFLRAIEFRANYGMALTNVGHTALALGRAEEALVFHQRALAIAGSAESLDGAGNALRKLGRTKEAIGAHEQALRMEPGRWETWSNLSLSQGEAGMLEEAVRSGRRAMELNPASAEVRKNLAMALDALGKKSLARDQDAETAGRYFEEAVGLDPSEAEMWGHLSSSLLVRGDVDGAREASRRAVDAKPNGIAARQSDLFGLFYDERVSPGELFEAHRSSGEYLAGMPEMVAARKPHGNARDPEKRLRIGYVSPDFFAHPVFYFMDPVLEAHNKAGFESYCYANVGSPDVYTDMLRAKADQWVDTRKMGVKEICEKIRADGIDILVDLSGHTSDQFPWVFSAKPAPVQVSWLGYPGPTCLPTVDYWVTDEHLDPPGQTEGFCTEQIVRLPDTFACYRLLKGMAEVEALPALKRGHVTFGSFNNLAKIRPGVLALWGRIMQEVPGSRLTMVTPMWKGEGAGREMGKKLKEVGIDAERVDFYGPRAIGEFFSLIGSVDVALDPFPFTGHTVSMHTLAMGVPIVTLEGKSHISRRGAMICRNMGLEEFVGRDQDEYVAAAVRAVGDLGKLSQLRMGLRERLEKSVLMDAGRFTRNLEDAYRGMWRKWCGE